MASCVVKTLPEFKKLSLIYGEDLAEALVMEYSVKAMKIKPGEEYYYPTKKELETYFAQDKANLAKRVTSALAVDPYMPIDAILSMLRGVVHRYGDGIFITRGYTNSGSLIHNTEAEKLIFQKNLGIVYTLAKDFPNIFRVYDSNKNANTKIVKINSVTERDAVPTSERADLLDKFYQDLRSDKYIMEKNKTREIATKLGDKFSKAFGIDNELITAEEAYDILANSETPYDGEAAFFYKNKIYFVDEALNLNSVLHEYAHPLIKGIALQNRKLFDNLYNDLKITGVGVSLIENVRANYPELEFESDRFKEEVLVNALEGLTRKEIQEQTKTDSGFKAFVKKLIYAIKQVIKKLTKNVRLDKLSENTTLEQLADMMVNEDFVIESLVFDESDFAEFKRSLEDVIKDFDKTPYKKLQEAINKAYSEAVYELDNLKRSPGRLKKELQGPDGMRILKYIKDELSKYQTVTDPAQADVDNVILAMEDQERNFRIRSLALVNTINDIAVFVENIEKVIDNINQGSLMTIDSISKIQYYKNFLVRQEQLIESIRKIVGLPKTNEFVTLLNQVLTNIKDAKDKVKEKEFQFVSNFYELSTSGMQENLEAKFKETMKTRMKGVDPTLVEEFTEKIIHTPYRGQSITITEKDFPGNPRLLPVIEQDIRNYFAKRLGKEQIEDYLEGKKGDIGYLAAMAVPYANIDDPLVGGFVRHMKEVLAQAQAKSLKQRDEILKKLLPSLREMGYQGLNKNNTQLLGDKLLFIDKTGYKDPKTGEWVEFEVKTVKNRFKNYRNDRGKLLNDFDLAKEKGNKDEIKQAYQAIQEFDEKYMYRENKKEYYDLQKIWDKDNTVINPFTKQSIVVSSDTSFEAYIERQSALNEMNTLRNVHFTELEDVQDFNQADEARMNYQQLYDVYNPDGTEKSGKELEKVLVRKMHKSESSKFWESLPDEDRAQKDLDSFVSKLASVGIVYESDPERFNEEIEKFKKKNFRIAYTESYYKSRQDIFRQLREITNKPGIKSKLATQIAELYQRRYELMNQITDKNGQVNGLKYTEGQKQAMLDIENEILNLNSQFDKKTGLSIEESTRLQTYQTRLALKQQLSQEELDDYNNLINIKNDIGLSPAELEKMRQLFGDLAQLTVKEPTEYYIESLNYVLRDTGIDPVTIDNADVWINSSKVFDAMTMSSEFKNWFLQNHYQKEVYDAASGQKIMMYYRTSLWSVSKPLNKDHYRTTTLINPVDGKPLIIDGVVSGKYMYQRIRDEYLTIPRGANRQDYVGKIIDNKGQYLPREYKPGDPNSAFDNKYINEDYVAQEKANTAEYRFIKAYTESLLMVQEDRPNASKLYLDLPRFSMLSADRNNLELLQSGKLKEQITDKLDLVKAIGERISGKGKPSDAFELELNYNTDQLLVSTDLQGRPISKIPVRGLYRMKASDVSSDPLRAIGDYLYSLNEQEALINNEALAKTILDVLNDDENAIKDMNKVSSQIKKNTGALSFLPTAGENRRSEAINYFIDKVFYGQVNSQFQEENIGLTKFANMLMKAANRSFMALDMVAAAKNKYGIQFQSLIEAAGGKYITLKSLAWAKVKSKESMIQLMGATNQGIYTVGPKGLLVQMLEYFDPTTGKTEADFSKSASRTLVKDMLDGTFLYDIRRFSDMMASIELYWGVMKNTFLEQKQENGTVKKISYDQAFEKDENGILKLKDGIDLSWAPQPTNHIFKPGDTLSDIAKKYDVTEEQLKERNGITDLNDFEEGDEIKISDNKKFLEVKLRIQGLGKRLNGMMDKLDSPQAKKHLGYKLFTFYRNFATGMTLQRWQYDTDPANKFGEVYDWDLNETTQGTYVRALRAIINGIRTRGASFAVMTSEEKAAFMKNTFEFMALIILGLSVGFLFGYDDDDKDRFEKLREREKNYGLLGWWANHMLYQTMMVKQENEAFNPILGINQYLSFFDKTTIASQPILGNGLKVLTDLLYWMTGDESAYYKQDVGPYSWQKEGSFKFYNHLGAIFGLKGKNYDPIHAIKQKETFDNLSGSGFDVSEVIGGLF